MIKFRFQQTIFYFKLHIKVKNKNKILISKYENSVQFKQR
jgi:hypothetical protein